MKNNFEECFELMLKSEGGYSNNKLDPGGITNLGVTKAAWESYLGHSVTEQDMRDLTPAVVKPFYKARYWDACRCDDLPAGLDLCVFDTAVNSGVGRAVKILQAAVGSVPDGAIGPITIASAQKSGDDLRRTISDYCARRQTFWEGLKDKQGNSLFKVFGKGWTIRGASIATKARSLTV